MQAPSSSFYQHVLSGLRASPRRWLVTGVAGFIGSNLLQTLLEHDQHVVGLDNFSTGHRQNLDDVQRLVGDRWARFNFIEGDIRDAAVCAQACTGIDFVLHQAALGSVPRSLADPTTTNDVNVGGFLNMLVAARDANVQRFVYAASSSTYGDHPDLPKVEHKIGRPLSPYAVTKYVNELYADVFGRCYNLHCIGLRYFNVFGPRQDPAGAYAAVIPKWAASMLSGETVFINGDGQTSRDFCFVANVVQANVLAATTDEAEAVGQVFNIAVGDQTTLSELANQLDANLRMASPELTPSRIQHRDFRSGDVRHSRADISKATRLLNYLPTHRFGEGLNEAAHWYVESFGRGRPSRP